MENVNGLIDTLKVNEGAIGSASKDVVFEDLGYQSGFGNHFSSEALKGALPVGQNSPLKCPYGLYAEQISGTAFTVPRKLNQRSWLYRMKPSVTHEPFHLREPEHKILVSEFTSTSSASITPTQLRWKPPPIPDAQTNFIDGLFTVCGAGSPFLRHGYAVHMYTANISMEGCAFANADGDLLIVPQLGRLWIKTEMGRLQVSPGELVVLQLGIRFAVELPDGPSRGYVLEVFDGHFQLPDLGPIGANGLADPRDFLTPRAWFEEKSCGAGGFRVIHKFGGSLFDAKQDFSPFNVVAWHGNYAPFKYNLKKFCPFNTVLFDHADPSINTVLTVPSEKPGVAVVDFVVFPPRWSVAEHTFRPPYFHRNCMSEFMGLIYGMYEGKAGGFVPGGASLHNCMTPHGVDTATYERTISEDPKPSKIPDGALAFMFESSLIPRVTPWALDSPQLDPDYYKCWIGLRSHFDRTKVPQEEDALSLAPTKFNAFQSVVESPSMKDPYSDAVLKDIGEQAPQIPNVGKRLIMQSKLEEAVTNAPGGVHVTYAPVNTAPGGVPVQYTPVTYGHGGVPVTNAPGGLLVMYAPVTYGPGVPVTNAPHERVPVPIAPHGGLPVANAPPGVVSVMNAPEGAPIKRKRGRPPKIVPIETKKKAKKEAHNLEDGSDSDEEGNTIKWRDIEIENLILIRSEMEPEFANSARKEGMNSWSKLQSRMVSTIPGFNRSWLSCKKKYKRYNKCLKSGQSPVPD